jgi:hypothetical protein
MGGYVASGGSIHDRRKIRFQPLGDATDQAPGIQQVLRAEMPLGPPVAGFEFDAEKIPNFAKNAIFHQPHEFAVGVAHSQDSALGYRPVYLQAGSGQGNVLQIGDTSPGSPALVFPLYVHEVRTQHPRFNTPVEHFFSLIPSLVVQSAGNSK